MNNLALARARARARGADEAGFSLIYVMMITTIVALLVTSTLVITSSSIVPAVRSAYAQAADAAAQSGLQAFVAYADHNCPATTSSVAECTLPSNYSGVVSIDIPNSNGSYTATYSWVATKDPNNRYFRVKSRGHVEQGGVSATKVIIGDIVGGATMDDLDYGVVTGFETQSSATILSDWPRRTIALDAAAIDAADVPIKGGQIEWSGSSPGTAAGKVAVCNAKFDDKGGRGNLPPPGSPNPYVDWSESGLNRNNYTNYGPCHTSWGNKTKLLAAANPDDGTGGYFSDDALLISNSYPGGTGPEFDQPVLTGWQYSAADNGVCSTVAGQNYRSFNLLCAGYPVEVGGTPLSTSLFPDIQWQPSGPQIPPDPIIPARACVYAGPTRVVLNGNTAVITSPETTSAWVTANAGSRPPQCYLGAGAQGMAQQTIDLTGISVISAANNGNVPTTTPATAHGSSGWPTTSQKYGDTASTTNSVFYLTNGTSGTSSSDAWTVTAVGGGYVPAVGDDPNDHSDGAWVPQWTSFTSGTTCGTSTSARDLKFFNCYQNGGASAYTTLKTTVANALTANPTSYDTAAEIQTYLNSVLAAGNSSDAGQSTPTYGDNTSHRWYVSNVASGTGGGCTQSSNVAGTPTDTTLPAPSSDALFDNKAGSVHAAPSTTTTCFTATVVAQIGQNLLGIKSWGDGGLLGLGIVPGSTIPQFKVTFTVKKTTTTTTTVAATSTFPSMSDVTQYQMGFNNTGNSFDSRSTFGQNGPGDLYVEGTISHTTALVADNDLVITGPTGPAGTNPVSPSTTDDNRDPPCGPDTGRTCPNLPGALVMVGRANVRVYHPVKCRVTDPTMIANTSAGFCPDDITGLYDSVLPDQWRPSQQYINLRNDLAGLTVHAAIFALGNAAAHITCPQPPNGGGVCNGEFTVDNYGRGASLGYFTEIGTLAMAHHSPVGQEWRIADVLGQSGRPYSGYQMAQQYQNLKALIAADPDVGGLLDTTSSTSSLWHILSVSTGSDS